MTYQHILRTLKSHYKPENIEGMARFGIVTKKAYGVPAPALRRLAREIGKDHALAQRLWSPEAAAGEKPLGFRPSKRSSYLPSTRSSVNPDASSNALSACSPTNSMMTTSSTR